MPKTFFISDTHFNNENVIKYCNRPFANADEMTQEMIRRWNVMVKPEDTVYHLGDFIMNRADNVQTIIDQLNGHIVLVRGNHDTKAKLKIYDDLYNGFKMDIKDIAYIPYKGLFFVCCHFPMDNPAFLQMVQRDNSEVVLVHGHVHDQAPFYTPETHSFNVSADAINFMPVDINVLWNTIRDDYIAKGVWTGK